MDFDEKMMTLVVHGATVPMIHVNTTAWFRATSCFLRGNVSQRYAGYIVQYDMAKYASSHDNFCV